MFRRGLSAVDVSVAIVVVLILLAFILFVCTIRVTRHGAWERAACESNLRQIGVALVSYATTNAGRFPTLTDPTDQTVMVGTNAERGGKDTEVLDPFNCAWRNLNNGAEDRRFFTSVSEIDNDPGNVRTASSGLWLLTVCGLTTPDTFICPESMSHYVPNDPLQDPIGSTRSPQWFSDFYCDLSGAGPLISYSFHNPWSEGWANTARPGLVIVADANNGADPAGSNEQTARSTNHRSEGMNILKVDTSVSWVESVHVGLDGDNIYTSNIKATDPFDPETTAGALDVNPRSGGVDTVLIPIDNNILKFWNTALKKPSP